MTAELFARIQSYQDPALTNLEIECRFRVQAQPADLTKLLAIGHWTLEQIITIIDGSLIKAMYFIAGQQDKARAAHYRKIALTRGLAVQGPYSAKLAISTETRVDPFVPSGSANLARLKLRHSISLYDAVEAAHKDPQAVVPALAIEFADWRFDCTVTQQCSTMSVDEIKRQKERMFTRGELLRSDVVEIELEYLGIHAEFNERGFSAAYLAACAVLEAAGITPEVQLTHPQHGQRGQENTSNTSSEREPSSFAIRRAYQERIYQLATLIKDNPMPFKHALGIKQLSNQVIELNKNVFAKELADRMDEFFVCDKLDGHRYILVIGPSASYAIGHNYVELDVRSVSGVTILDTEFYVDSYYPFDCLMFEDKKIVDRPTNERLELMHKAIATLGAAARLKEKPWFTLEQASYRKQFAELEARKTLPYKTDGLILTPKSSTYFEMRVFKYKDVDHLTIDFLLKRVPEGLVGRAPYVAKRKAAPIPYALCCGIQATQRDVLRMYPPGELTDIVNHGVKPGANYVPCIFRPSSASDAYLFWTDDKHLHDTVGEFRYTPGSWELVKRRDDRQVEVNRRNYFGNNMRVAEAIWMNIGDPLHIPSYDDQAFYFKQHDAAAYQIQRQINNVVKRELIETTVDRTCHTLIDFASGNGQDIFKYAAAGITKLMAMDIDSCALMELCERKYGIREPNTMAIDVSRVDLNRPADKTIREIELAHSDLPTKFDVAMCHMAAHYFMATEASCANFAECIAHFLGPGRPLLITTFDGEKVEALLAANNGLWESEDTRFRIQWAAQDTHSTQDSQKKSEKSGFGRKISVRLPFSKTILYDEYLIDRQALITCFSNYGLEFVAARNFAELAPDVARDSVVRATPDDIKFIGLYTGLIFKMVE